MSSNLPPQRCANPDCSAVFVAVKKGGTPKKYCTTACCQRAFYHYASGQKDKKLSREARRHREFPSRSRYNKALRAYGLTADDFQMLLVRQRGGCAICGTWDPKGAGGWHIDHDHGTKNVRGLLCTHCNVGIGMLKDDPSVVAKAGAYLVKWKEARA